MWIAGRQAVRASDAYANLDDGTVSELQQRVVPDILFFERGDNERPKMNEVPEAELEEMEAAPFTTKRLDDVAAYQAPLHRLSSHTHTVTCPGCDWQDHYRSLDARRRLRDAAAEASKEIEAKKDSAVEKRQEAAAEVG